MSLMDAFESLKSGTNKKDKMMNDMLKRNVSKKAPVVKKKKVADANASKVVPISSFAGKESSRTRYKPNKAARDAFLKSMNSN